MNTAERIVHDFVHATNSERENAVRLLSSPMCLSSLGGGYAVYNGKKVMYGDSSPCIIAYRPLHDDDTNPRSLVVITDDCVIRSYERDSDSSGWVHTATPDDISTILSRYIDASGYGALAAMKLALKQYQALCINPVIKHTGTYMMDISDDEIRDMSTSDMNRLFWAYGCTRSEILYIKRKRRRLKARVYYQKSKAKQV